MSSPGSKKELVTSLVNNGDVEGFWAATSTSISGGIIGFGSYDGTTHKVDEDAFPLASDFQVYNLSSTGTITRGTNGAVANFIKSDSTNAMIYVLGKYSNGVWSVRSIYLLDYRLRKTVRSKTTKRCTPA